MPYIISGKEFGCSNQYQCKKDKERRNCKMLPGNDWMIGVNKLLIGSMHGSRGPLFLES